MNRSTIPTPVELLYNHLHEMTRDLQKSKEMFAANLITEELHMLHKKNIEPKIEEYQKAIHKLLDQ